MSRIAFFIYGVAAYLLFFATFLYAVGFLANTGVPKGIDDGVTGYVVESVEEATCKIGSLLALAAGRSIAYPLVELGSAARAIAAGAPPRFPRSGIPEIDSLVQALREMHHQLADRFGDLRREQAETAALVESMVEGVIATDERGRIVTANNAARRMLGYSRSDVLPDLPELFRVKAAR
jgi:signal transduction histidine kinase